MKNIDKSEKITVYKITLLQKVTLLRFTVSLWGTVSRNSESVIAP